LGAKLDNFGSAAKNKMNSATIAANAAESKRLRKQPHVFSVLFGNALKTNARPPK
jgi:hypothetical protein